MTTLLFPLPLLQKQIPIVLGGYDVVAYSFMDISNSTCGAPVLGIPNYSYNLESADENGDIRVYAFHFGSQDNLDLFAADPWKWAPAYGGFCSWGACCETEELGWPWSANLLGPPAGPDVDKCGYRVFNDTMYISVSSAKMDEFMDAAALNIHAGEE